MPYLLLLGEGILISNISVKLVPCKTCLSVYLLQVETDELGFM
jgi:hypothetical protein